MERRKPQRSTIKIHKNRTLTVYLPLSYLNGFYFVTSDLTKKKSKKKSQLFLKFPTYSPMSFDVLWANNIMLKGVSSKPSGKIIFFIFIELNYPKFSLKTPFKTLLLFIKSSFHPSSTGILISKSNRIRLKSQYYDRYNQILLAFEI